MTTMTIPRKEPRTLQRLVAGYETVINLFKRKPRTIQEPSDLKNVKRRGKVIIPGYAGTYQLWKKDNSAYVFADERGAIIPTVTLREDPQTGSLTEQYIIYSKNWDSDKYWKAKEFLTGETQ